VRGEADSSFDLDGRGPPGGLASSSLVLLCDSESVFIFCPAMCVCLCSAVPVSFVVGFFVCAGFEAREKWNAGPVLSRSVYWFLGPVVLACGPVPSPVARRE